MQDAEGRTGVVVATALHNFEVANPEVLRACAHPRRLPFWDMLAPEASVPVAPPLSPAAMFSKRHLEVGNVLRCGSYAGLVRPTPDRNSWYERICCFSRTPWHDFPVLPFFHSVPFETIACSVACLQSAHLPLRKDHRISSTFMALCARVRIHAR